MSLFPTLYETHLLISCSLEQAKQKDEKTSRLFDHFSAKYGRDQVTRLVPGLLFVNGPLQSISNKEQQHKHLFSIYHGGGKTDIERASDADT
jgi:hypothetical protein